MSDELDLDAIEARCHRAQAPVKTPNDLWLSTRDVPALLAEVKRLRATTPEWEYGVNRPGRADPTPDNEGNK